jgi:hypothetical protein
MTILWEFDGKHQNILDKLGLVGHGPPSTNCRKCLCRGSAHTRRPAGVCCDSREGLLAVQDDTAPHQLKSFNRMDARFFTWIIRVGSHLLSNLAVMRVCWIANSVQQDIPAHGGLVLAFHELDDSVGAADVVGGSFHEHCGHCCADDG